MLAGEFVPPYARGNSIGRLLSICGPHNAQHIAKATHVQSPQSVSKRPTRTVLTLGSPELGQAFVAKTIADVAQEVAAL
jgi:hypothetical protein